MRYKSFEHMLRIAVFKSSRRERLRCMIRSRKKKDTERLQGQFSVDIEYDNSTSV